MRICLCACECHLFYNTSGAVTIPPPMVTAGGGTESSVSLFNIIIIYRHFAIADQVAESAQACTSV